MVTSLRYKARRARLNAVSTHHQQKPEREPGAGEDGTIRIQPLAGMSSGHMQRITLAFLEEAPRRLDAARAALEAGNAAMAAAAIHALKGSASYLSDSQLHGLCALMEEAAISGDLPATRAYLPAITAALEQACADLASVTP